MKSLKTTALFALISLSSITTIGAKSVMAQTGTDPWTGATYDTSNCVGYNSCYVDSTGNVSGSNNIANPYEFHYSPDHTNEYRLLH